MIDKIDITNVLFLDIETVSGHRSFDDLSEEFQKLWKLKCRSILKRYDEPITVEEARAAYTEKAGIFAEFGKIVCISVGIVVRDSETQTLHVRLKSFADHDEKKLLQDYSELIKNYYWNVNKHFQCGHNLKEFDIPYICRRMLIHQMPLPRPLDISGAKPWEMKHLLDTMVMWRFGDYKNYTALKLLCACFGVPSPKDDIDGSEVGRVYWEEDDLERIAVYCEKDVLAVVQLLLRYKRQPLLEGSQIKFVDRSQQE